MLGVYKTNIYTSILPPSCFVFCEKGQQTVFFFFYHFSHREWILSDKVISNFQCLYSTHHYTIYHILSEVLLSSQKQLMKKIKKNKINFSFQAQRKMQNLFKSICKHQFFFCLLQMTKIRFKLTLFPRFPKGKIIFLLMHNKILTEITYNMYDTCCTNIWVRCVYIYKTYFQHV